MLFALSIAGSVLLGAGLAYSRVGRWARIGGYTVILVLSNVWMCMPYFLADPKTWHVTFLTGLAQTGIVSILVHVLPAAITRSIIAKILSKRNASEQTGH
jgi:hypothetical protein